MDKRIEAKLEERVQSIQENLDTLVKHLCRMIKIHKSKLEKQDNILPYKQDLPYGFVIIGDDLIIIRRYAIEILDTTIKYNDKKFATKLRNTLSKIDACKGCRKVLTMTEVCDKCCKKDIQRILGGTEICPFCCNETANENMIILPCCSKKTKQKVMCYDCFLDANCFCPYCKGNLNRLNMSRNLQNLAYNNIYIDKERVKKVLETLKYDEEDEDYSEEEAESESEEEEEDFSEEEHESEDEE